MPIYYSSNYHLLYEKLVVLFRWNSTYDMVARILEQKEAVNRVLRCNRKSEALALNWQTVDVLESIEKALKPISNLTDALSGWQAIHFPN